MSRAAVSIVFQILIFINTFLIIATFRDRGLGDDSLDWQVLLKLGFWMISFCFSMIFWRHWAAKLFRYDNIFLCFLFVVMIISCLQSPSFNYSLGATFSVIAVILTFFAASVFMSQERMAAMIFASITFVCVISIPLYFLLPDVARFKEWVGDVEVPGSRLSGIAGTPNGVGFACAFALMIAFYHYRSWTPRFFLLFWAAVLINVVSLGMSWSRTSMAALVLSLAIGYFAKLSKERLLLASAGVLALCALIYVIDIESVMISLSRSGNAEEITTGTGRTHIWETSLHLISEKPFMGWGYASSVFIFPKMAAEIGHAPPNAHNLVLQVLFSVGYIGFFVFVLMYLIKFYYCFKFQDLFKISLLSFLFINGLTEALLFRGTASSAHIMFALVFANKYMRRGIDQFKDKSTQRGKHEAGHFTPEQ